MMCSVLKKHWEAGAKLMLDYGYPEVADIVDAHMNYIPEVPVTYIDEKISSAFLTSCVRRICL